jgi:hypothetical protein
MRTRPSLTVAAAAASLVLVGGIAYAAVQSVDTTPKSQILVPRTSASQPSHSHGSDDPVGHDANDDHGGAGHSGSGHGSDG